MVPSSKWFPSSLADRATWFDNFNTQFATVCVPVLVLPIIEVTNVANDNESFQWMADSNAKIESFKDAARQYRVILTEGAIGEPNPDYPTLPTDVPSIDVDTGIFQRLDNLVKRIRSAPNYTNEVGVLLGIVPTAGDSFTPETAKPVIEAMASPGNVVLVKFVRGGSDGIYIQTAVDKGDWTNQGGYLKSPVSLNIPANAEDLPRSVQIRARYLDGNTPVGDYSDVVTVQTVP